MRRKNLIWATILTACLIASGTAFGGITINSHSVDFGINGAGGTLTVKGPANFSFSQSFKGQDVSFSVFDSEGGVLADGLYKYEVAVTGVAVGDREDHFGQGEYVTGTFSIENGSFVNPGLIEGGFNKDQVILDDLIVDGSICAGFDCVNGESFGFDTLRLKENNLRIRAVDTSNSASFPSRDWQIVFNDTSNGGMNKFSIDDIDGGRTPFTIEAGAPSHSLYVDDGGRLGLGTSTPVVDIHVKSGNTPTLRLEQDGSSGFGAQTWDLAGNEANFFIRDASNGSALAFRIFPGSGTSNALNIAASGDIGFGTTSPSTDLHIFNSAASANSEVRLEVSGRIWDLRSLQSSGVFAVRDATATTAPFRIGPGANTNLLQLGLDDMGNSATGQVTIDGELVITGNCTEVNGACADYVFEPGYELRSLDEVETFIATNGHLPNVPSTEDIKKNGVSVQRMQGRLLEKIEELTLYTLAQQKMIEELQARLAEPMAAETAQE